MGIVNRAIDALCCTNLQDRRSLGFDYLVALRKKPVFSFWNKNISCPSLSFYDFSYLRQLYL